MMRVRTQSHKSHQNPKWEEWVTNPTGSHESHHSLMPSERARPWAKEQKGHQKAGHPKGEEKVKLDHVGRAVHWVTPGLTVPTKVQGNQVNATGSRQIALTVVSGDTLQRHVLGQKVQERLKAKESQKEKEKEAPKVKVRVKVQHQWR